MPFVYHPVRHRSRIVVHDARYLRAKPVGVSVA
jgi:hypothetical protein